MSAGSSISPRSAAAAISAAFFESAVLVIRRSGVVPRLARGGKVTTIIASRETSAPRAFLIDASASLRAAGAPGKRMSAVDRGCDLGLGGEFGAESREHGAWFAHGALR